MYMRTFTALAIVCSVLIPSDFSHAAEIGELGKVTPNGPYRLWTAVNKGLLEYAFVKGGKELKAKVATLTPTDLKGKKPGDVLKQGAIFRGFLDSARAKIKLPPASKYRDPQGRAVTPAVVFLNAGHLLDGLFHLIAASNKGSNDGLGEIYNVAKFKGKSPSNVFSQVELATRRLDMIRGL